MIIRFKHDQETPYTVISNQLIDDNKLSFKNLLFIIIIGKFYKVGKFIILIMIENNRKYDPP